MKNVKMSLKSLKFGMIIIVGFLCAFNAQAQVKKSVVLPANNQKEEGILLQKQTINIGSIKNTYKGEVVSIKKEIITDLITKRKDSMLILSTFDEKDMAKVCIYDDEINGLTKALNIMKDYMSVEHISQNDYEREEIIFTSREGCQIKIWIYNVSNLRETQWALSIQPSIDKGVNFYDANIFDKIEELESLISSFNNKDLN